MADDTMSGEQAENMQSGVMAPPAVTMLKDDAAARSSARVQMERSISMDIREERADLKEAAEQSMNVILDLNLDNTIRWVSPSWETVIGTSPDSVQGKPIADLIEGNTTQFADTVENMKKDDSRSQIIRFSIKMGPSSLLRPKRSPRMEECDQESPSEPREDVEEEHILNLEAQGIMVYDRTSGEESHVSAIPRYRAYS